MRERHLPQLKQATRASLVPSSIWIASKIAPKKFNAQFVCLAFTISLWTEWPWLLQKWGLSGRTSSVLIKTSILRLQNLPFIWHSGKKGERSGVSAAVRLDMSTGDPGLPQDPSSAPRLCGSMQKTLRAGLVLFCFVFIFWDRISLCNLAVLELIM